MIRIDINCDVGEGVGNEPDLMPLISSCNIACGGHAGDHSSMDQTISLALKNNVKIGVHPSYPDRENFGRQPMDMSPKDLTLELRKQVASFLEILNRYGADLHHIKPHGALYNAIAKDEVLAHCFLDAISEYDGVPIYVPFGSKIESVAMQRGYPFFLEAFADRTYDDELKLVSRTKPNSVLKDPKLVMEHLILMVKEQKVKTIDGNLIGIQADTFCVHGDTPSALEILTYLHQELPNHNIQIKR